MVNIKDIVAYCNERTHVLGIKDFRGALNGLQVSNSGKVTKIGASVDAGVYPFRLAIEKGVDFLIVHHGLFWRPLEPITGVHYEKIKMLFDNNLAVYSNHLPLDAHEEIGNNAMIAKRLGLNVIGRCLVYEGTEIGILAEGLGSREILSEKLRDLFPKSYMGIEFGSDRPERIVISSGSGASVIEELVGVEADTLITGELRQHHYNQAQELKLNLYPCGHYATEVFGVQELAREVSEKFKLPWEFIPTECSL